MAKNEVQADELAIVHSMDPTLVTLRKQRQTGVLLSCEGERRYGWSGGLWVTAHDPTLVPDILADLQAEWSIKDGYTARLSSGVADDPLVEIRHRSGDGYFVGPQGDGSELTLTSFSRCFQLPEGESPGGSF